jgi:hypothetical protein
MKIAKVENDPGKLKFLCPGCGSTHYINISGENRPVWGFNGDFEKPTLTPSVLVTWGHYLSSHKPGDRCWCDYNREHPDEKPVVECGRCHSFVTNGTIKFLTDSTHALAGQIVDLPDIE